MLLAEPSAVTLVAGESITVTVVLDTGGWLVDTVDIFLQYDATQLRADSVSPLASDLYPLAMGVEGSTVVFSAGTALDPVRWRVPLAAVRFTALTDTAASPLVFQRAKPLRWSSAWHDGIEVMP